MFNARTLGLCLLACLAHPIHALETSETLTFDNFGERVVLELAPDGAWVESHPKFEVGVEVQRPARFEVSDRLIVGSRHPLSSAVILEKHPSIISARPLYEGEQAFFYAAVLNAPEAMSEALAAMNEFAVVQPDLLQLVDEAHGTEQHSHDGGHFYTAYLDTLGVPDLWRKTLGRGTTVAVIDDGYDLGHAELAKVKVLQAFDLDSGRPQASPQADIDTHGTRVAGIIFAQHETGSVHGLAPEASMIALRHTSTWTSQTLRAFNLAKEADIINCSWVSRRLVEPIAAVVEDLAMHGRRGKGTMVVFSAGNRGELVLPRSTEASIEAAVVVGSHNPKFVRQFRSNHGSTVDLKVFGARAPTTAREGSPEFIASTSLAAAIVSGLGALLLSVEPDLSLDELVTRLKDLTAQDKVVDRPAWPARRATR